jgi:replicative DNA helicase
MSQHKENPGAGGQPGRQNLHRVFDGTLPHYEDYEKNILGCILEDWRLIKQVQLKPEDFYSTRHQFILSTMLNMQAKAIPIDELTIYEELKKRGLLDEVGGITYLGYLKDIAVSPANINYHTEKVKEASLNRNLWENSERLKQAIERGEDEEAIRILQNQVSQWKSSIESKLKPISAKELEAMPLVESLWGEILFPECITQVNSEPGVGKSTLFYNLCAYGANGKDFLEVSFSRRIKSLYVDLETPRWKRKE